MTKTMQEFDETIAVDKRNATRRYERHVTDVGRGRSNPDLSIATRAGRNLEQFKVDVQREAARWEISKRMQQLQSELESSPMPLPGEAECRRFGCGERRWQPLQDFHGHIRPEDQLAFNAFMKRCAEHDQSKIECRAELEQLREELSSMSEPAE